MNPASQTVLYQDPLFLEHDPGAGHPESSARLSAVYRDLAAKPVPGVRVAAPRPASCAEIERLHASRYVDRVAATAGRRHTQLDQDTVASARSWEAARKAAGAALQAVEAVAGGEATHAFALVRPPGHHAERNAAMGFCLFNNVALAAEHAVREGGFRRVLILDPDVHHGNGTQNFFWERSDVLYVSSHRYPFYPGTGAFAEFGAGDGAGFTLNLPLPAGAGDDDFLFLYREVVGRVVGEYAPELILVSAGFDTWKADPLGGMRVGADGFRGLFGLFADWAAQHCPGHLVAVLEGGYDPAGNVAGVRAGLEAMRAAAGPAGSPGATPSKAAAGVAGLVCRQHTPFWNSLADLAPPA